ncbi:MAG: glycosyl transferase family 1, partial [Chloroflexota bacterium]
ADGEPRITFAGAYDNRRVAEVLAGLDVCVVPSIWYENLPTIILEAQAWGTPVVTANLGGMAEMVHHDVDGLLFRPGDADDLARQLQRLLDEPDLLPRLRANAPPVMTLEEQMQALMEVYRAASGERLAAWG